MTSIALLPLFKGDVPPPSGPDATEKRRLNEAVITGRDPVHGNKLEPGMYLECLRQVKRTQREIAENVARVFAMTLNGAHLHRQGHEVRPYFLEGCTWDWGTSNPRRGCDVSAAIYNMVPNGLRWGAGKPHIDARTKRTRDEFEYIFALSEVRGDKEVLAVTHGYHAARAEQIGWHMRRRGEHYHRLGVRTPSAIASEFEHVYNLGNELSPATFLIDAIRIAEPTLQTTAKEGIKEKGILYPLHLIERTTGMDIEKNILAHMAGRNDKGSDEDSGTPL